MKKALFFALALAAICIIPSCKKNPAQTKVVFGDTHGMSVTSYDSTLSIEQYAHYSWGNTVDLDGNPTTLTARGRHDPCVLPREAVVHLVANLYPS